MRLLSSFTRQQRTSYANAYLMADVKYSFVVAPVDITIKREDLRTHVVRPLLSACSFKGIDIEFVQRIKSSPVVVVTCSDANGRAAILSRKQEISSACGFILDAYLTPQQLQTRASMGWYYNALKLKGYMPHWKLDRLYFMHEGKSLPFNAFSAFGRSLFSSMVTPSFGTSCMHEDLAQEPQPTQHSLDEACTSTVMSTTQSDDTMLNCSSLDDQEPPLQALSSFISTPTTAPSTSSSVVVTPTPKISTQSPQHSFDRLDIQHEHHTMKLFALNGYGASSPAISPELLFFIASCSPPSRLMEGEEDDRADIVGI